MSTDARTEILRRIRNSQGDIAFAESAAQGWLNLPRHYRRTATRSPEEILLLFEDRLRDYDADVVRAKHNCVADSIASLLEKRGKQTLVMPQGISFALPEGYTFLTDEVSQGGLTAAELNAVDGVLTGATVAIAETGTIVLQSVAGQGRRAISLVPDYHLCVVNAMDIVETVAEAIARLQPHAALPTTFFSGPSATADIEMTRIKGVHGPRFVDVVLVSQ
jgi:L-lactate dehydrogenase complex protein LldG